MKILLNIGLEQKNNKQDMLVFLVNNLDLDSNSVNKKMGIFEIEGPYFKK